MNDVFAWSGLALGILGAIAFAWSIWARNNPKRTLISLKVRQTGIGIPTDKRIHVTYDGKTVEQPTLVEFIARHQGGGDIAAKDVPEDAIVAVARTDTVLGPIADGESLATYGADSRTLAMRPYLISAKGERVARFLADGVTTFDTSLNLANARPPRGPRLSRSVIAATIAFGASLVGLGAFALGSGLIGPWIPWVFALGAVVMPVAMWGLASRTLDDE